MRLAIIPLLAAQLTIIHTGSTNVPGMTVAVEKSGLRATIERHDGTQQTMNLSSDVYNRFVHDLEAAGPLNELPVNHCMKSASFGSSLYVEWNGVRSRDLSCPKQADPRAAAIAKDAAEILKLARNSEVSKREQ